LETEIANAQSGQFLLEVGRAVVDIVIGIATLLTKSESSPGLIAVFLVFLLGIASAIFIFQNRRRAKAIHEMHGMLAKYGSVTDFSSNFEEFRHQLSERKHKNKSWFALWEAWDEFSETIVTDDLDGSIQLRNSIRPSSFMNVEDLGFGPGVFRIAPNFFVSLGLFLTFLGLVAALHEFSRAMNADAGTTLDRAMTDFMRIASAKFIMSLVGLMCSIIFNVLMRERAGALDRALHNLCIKIERRLIFVSLRKHLDRINAVKPHPL
jgi:hypothetical protein